MRRRRTVNRKPGFFRLTNTPPSCKIISVKEEEVTELGEFVSIEEAKIFLEQTKGLEGQTLHILTTTDNRAVYTEKR
tara:strand:+ start:32 stop:262 length:231 start_codon:yes stop_codon:yes gene_type:complete